MNAPQNPKTLTIATRGSQLALWQANHVASLLATSGLPCVTSILKTTADRIQDRPLHELGGKGLFVKELEEALLTGEADLAVHSLKDMPARLDPRFALPCILKRHQAGDLLILRKDVGTKLGLPVLDSPASWQAKQLSALPPLKIGTGSLRRQALLRQVAPQLTPVGIRGNVDTRLRKLAEGHWDAIILAEASIERLAISGLVSVRLDPAWFVPCAGQGALALETLSANSWLRDRLMHFAHADTAIAVTIERRVLAELGGDCNMPFGCYVYRDAYGWHGRAAVYDTQGQAAISTCSLADADFSTDALSNNLRQGLRAAGAAKILRTLGLPIPEAYA